uniref:Uncharacterized protein n=1 Tax=Knipowitschia caucasica TaxID=637954 RepID=A0AAV2LL08_KNICA
MRWSCLGKLVCLDNRREHLRDVWDTGAGLGWRRYGKRCRGKRGQLHRDDIKMDIGTQILDLKEDILSLRNDARADIKTLREELTGELAKLSNKQAEATRQMEDLGNTLSDMIDSRRIGAQPAAYDQEMQDSKKNSRTSKTGAGDVI